MGVQNPVKNLLLNSHWLTIKVSIHKRHIQDWDVDTKTIYIWTVLVLTEKNPIDIWTVLGLQLVYNLSKISCNSESLTQLRNYGDHIGFTPPPLNTLKKERRLHFWSHITYVLRNDFSNIYREKLGFFT